MEPLNWAPEHSGALREFIARGMSLAEAAAAINEKFGASYSRNAIVSRASRMGLLGGKGLPALAAPVLNRLGETLSAESKWRRFRVPPPLLEPTKMAMLRCVEIEPRRLSLADLERGDCRYPYGGDEEGEAITFCGHPRRSGSSYCTPHFHLSRDPGTPSEHTAQMVLLRVIEAT
jgi:GcrA cell cycle regulator